MNCFDVFITVLVTVILVHLHHDHTVTTFELSHFNLYPKQTYFYFLSEINIFNKLLLLAWHDIAFLC